MYEFIKENLNRILLLLLASLFLILWGRFIIREINLNNHTKELFTLKARTNCAESFGWIVDPGSEMYETVNLPEEFDNVLIEYNKLQKMCGFDLNKYCGKTIKKYTYIATNFPYKISETVYINLLIYEDKLIGGDCMTQSIHGFMLPLDRRFAP
ncbi:MAG: DUF4830 domain-containing protein [Clostridia bacterium]|nr:DUF4830 domain-containing protein [Clostridia bacterium]